MNRTDEVANPDEVHLLEVLASARDSIEEVLAGHVTPDRVTTRIAWAGDRLRTAYALSLLVHPPGRGALGAYRRKPS
ncbi:MAG TPA: hypothetical protein VM345_17900 [Acidimicrobiales bacterium]|nr:hypothetical protein [Acidimicrobiales bacterium]